MPTSHSSRLKLHYYFILIHPHWKILRNHTQFLNSHSIGKFLSCIPPTQKHHLRDGPASADIAVNLCFKFEKSFAVSQKTSFNICFVFMQNYMRHKIFQIE